MSFFMCRIIILFLVFYIPVNVALAGKKSNGYTDSIAVLTTQGIRNHAQIDRVNKLIEAQCNSGNFVSDSLINPAQEVVEAARQLNYSAGLADALLNLVRIYLDRYESTKSLEYALEAYNLYEKNGDHSKMAYMLMQLGIIYYTQNNFNKSLEYYNNSVSEYEKIGDKSRIATLFYLSGINYSKLKNYPSSLTFFNRAKEIKTAINDEKGIAECNIGLAELFIGMNNPDSAVYYLGLARTFTTKTNNRYGNAKSDILKAEALFLKQEYDTAIAYANEGLKLADFINARELMVDAYKILYRISSQKKDYENAFKQMLNYTSLRDSIVNEKTTRNLSRLEGDFILEKKQSEILLLEKENRNRSILLRASIIIGILALLLSLLYYNKNQIKNKANKKLEKAYYDLETTQQQLVQQEKLASLGHLTAGIAHEIKNPLNFVNNFSHLSVELLKELNETDNNAEKELIFKDIVMNIEKIAHHGERANSIVTRMLEHSRTGKREIEPTDLNRLIKEYVQLAYQALRIKHPGFSCTIVTRLDEKIPVLNLVSQEISRVLLNIFNNCLYVVAEKYEADKSFHPELKVTAAIAVNQVIITIRDNGPGIPEKIRERIFQPFFTTKPAGEGTGLGLSISYDIIKAHGGNITATNHAEGGAAFTITLPVQ